MVVGYTGGKATGKLTWDPKSIPPGVSLSLSDLGNGGSSIEMSNTGSYEFNLNGTDSLEVTAVLTGIAGGHASVPKEYALYQNYPNPFNPTTTIRFDLKETSTVRLEIYNVLGQQIVQEDFGTLNGGEYSRNINMSSYASGVYFYRLIANGNTGERFVAIKKLMLLK